MKNIFVKNKYFLIKVFIVTCFIVVFLGSYANAVTELQTWESSFSFLENQLVTSLLEGKENKIIQIIIDYSSNKYSESVYVLDKKGKIISDATNDNKAKGEKLNFIDDSYYQTKEAAIIKDNKLNYFFKPLYGSKVLLGYLVAEIKEEEDKFFSQNKFAEYAIETQTENVVRQMEIYLKAKPNKTDKEIFEDKEFRDIVFQPFGGRGYGAIADPVTSRLVLHPDKNVIGVDLSLLGEKASDWWNLFKKTTEEETCGYYVWPEKNGTRSDKYLCSRFISINNKKYSFAVTAYTQDFENIDEGEAAPYLFAAESIKQKAKDVAKQIEIYIKLNPNKSMTDLQADDYFREIAVQKVGKTGYTAVTDYNTLVARWHKNPDIVNLDLHSLADKLPGFWGIMKRTRGGHEASGMYNWQEADGSVEKKYMYIALVDAKTADGVGFNVAATTYLYEYKQKEAGDELNNFSISLLDILAEKIDSKLENIENDLRFLKNFSEMKKFANGDASAKSRLTDLFYYFSQSRSLYYQIRYLSSSGEELIRIDKVDNKSTIIEEEKLQNKKNRYYFEDIMNLDNNDIYISPLDLNMEQGKLENRSTEEDPIFVPVIRYATPVFDDSGIRSGMVLLNVYADEILNFLREEQSKTGKEIYLVNKEGFFLFHPDNTKEFGFMHSNNNTVLNDMGDGFQKIFFNKQGLVEENNKKYGYKKIFFSKHDIFLNTDSYLQNDKELSKNNNNYFWVLIAEQDKRVDQPNEINLKIQNSSFIKYFYWLIAALLFIFFVLFVLYQFHIVKFEKSISFYLLAVTLFLIIGLFLLNTWQISRNMKASVLDYYKAQQRSLARQIARDIEYDINIIMDDLSATIDSQAFLGRNKKSEYEILKRSQERLKRYVDSLYLLNPNGTIESKISSEEYNCDVGDECGLEPESIGAIAAIESGVSPFFQNKSGNISFSIVAPIKKDNKLAGLISANIYLKTFLERHLLPLVQEGDRETRLIVGDKCFGIDTNIFRPKKEIRDNIIAGNFGELIASSNHLNSNDTDKKQKLITYHPIKVKNKYWGISLSESVEDILAPMTSSINTLWFSTVGIILLIIIIGIISIFLLTASLKKEVMAKTAEIQGSAKVIKGQLKKEEKISQEKEELIKEQKKAKIELEDKVEELEKFQSLTVDRELRMIELKKKIKKLGG